MVTDKLTNEIASALVVLGMKMLVMTDSGTAFCSKNMLMVNDRGTAWQQIGFNPFASCISPDILDDYFDGDWEDSAIILAEFIS